MQGQGKREIPERTRRQAASSCTIPTCENPEAALPEISPGSHSLWGFPDLENPHEEVKGKTLVLGAKPLGREEGEVSVEQRRNERAGEVGEIPEKTRQPSASSGTIPTCKYTGTTSPGIEPGSSWWEASSITTTPPWPHLLSQNKTRISPTLFPLLHGALFCARSRSGAPFSQGVQSVPVAALTRPKPALSNEGADNPGLRHQSAGPLASLLLPVLIQLLLPPARTRCIPHLLAFIPLIASIVRFLPPLQFVHQFVAPLLRPHLFVCYRRRSAACFTPLLPQSLVCRQSQFIRILPLNTAAVAELLVSSPPIKANRVQSPAGSPNFRVWKLYRTMSLVGGFSAISSFPDLSIRALPHTQLTSPSSALKTSMLQVAQIYPLHLTSVITIDVGTDLLHVLPGDRSGDHAWQCECLRMMQTFHRNTRLVKKSFVLLKDYATVLSHQG
ncbi:hypothetical protein PR048_007786 [Dryococelus australis]|uniref:Uncharacterized protein n=1 Tax=Dryococelus australis TaxID=614101 RepID=A0ABQ9HV82_9NEOP|nr:hypothetical protein PR048_007786 [Dryococelus australis]